MSASHGVQLTGIHAWAVICFRAFQNHTHHAAHAHYHPLLPRNCDFGCSQSCLRWTKVELGVPWTSRLRFNVPRWLWMAHSSVVHLLRPKYVPLFAYHTELTEHSRT